MEQDLLETLERIRGALTEPRIRIDLRCFSEEEADALRAALTPAERARVRFRWLTFRKIQAVPER